MEMNSKYRTIFDIIRNLLKRHYIYSLHDLNGLLNGREVNFYS